MRKSDLKSFLLSFFAGSICLLLPALASIEFEYLNEKGLYIFVLPLIGFFCSLGLLHIIIELALSHDDFFVIIGMGGIMPAGLLPFLAIIAFQEHSITMFSRFLLALIIISLFMILIGMCFELYDGYGIYDIRTFFWVLAAAAAFCVVKWTSLSKTIGAATILDNRLNSSLDFLSTLFR